VLRRRLPYLFQTLGRVTWSLPGQRPMAPPEALDHSDTQRHGTPSAEGEGERCT